MKKIFGQYGGVIIVVIAIVALISLVGFLMQSGGVLHGALGSITNSFVDKTDELLNESVPEIAPEYTNVSGPIIALDDVSPVMHDLHVKLTSETVSDFSNVTIKKYGKNLLNPNEFSLNCPAGCAINFKNEDGIISYDKTSGAHTAALQVVVHLTKGTYCFSFDASYTDPLIVISPKNDSSNKIVNSYSDTVSFDITEMGYYKIAIFGIYNVSETTNHCISNIQLEVGSQTEYVPYIEPQTVKANADGTVSGLTSVSPNMTLTADDDVVISCDYQKAINSNDMEPGKVLTIGTTMLKKNKIFSFCADINSFDGLRISHGESNYGSGYVEVTNTSIDVYQYRTQNQLVKTLNHGLTLENNLEVLLSVDEFGKLSVSLISGSETFTANNICAFSGRGIIQAESINSFLTNVLFTWSSSDFDQEVWIFGDSYVSINSSHWPYYLLVNKDNFALSGYPGARSAPLYDDFINGLKQGKPQYAVWCLGMNEGDSGTAVNATWEFYVEKFIATCEENGITPILATIPNTPTINNSFKNEYIRNSGLRYIDFASAVGATEIGSAWNDGLLSSDNVHPTELGAQVLAEQVLQDLPELQ